MTSRPCPAPIHRISGADLGLRGGRIYDVAGRMPPEPRVAVVGSRAAQHRLRRLVPAMISAAKACGWSLVSGGALGIDGDAHRAGLAEDLDQLAVLPCGADRPYPPDHVPLFQAMISAGSGGLLFAQPRGTRPVRAMFASRNALVVELTQAMIVVQASLRSGSVGTGRLALSRGRRVLVCAGSQGCASLLAQGAERLPASSALEQVKDDVRSWLDAVRAQQPASWHDPWPEHLLWLRAHFNARGSRGLTADHLPDPLAGVCALSEAEARQLVEEVAPGRFIATGCP